MEEENSLVATAVDLINATLLVSFRNNVYLKLTDYFLECEKHAALENPDVDFGSLFLIYKKAQEEINKETDRSKILDILHDAYRDMLFTAYDNEIDFDKVAKEKVETENTEIE